jgi:hypothetical protein
VCNCWCKAGEHAAYLLQCTALLCETQSEAHTQDTSVGTTHHKLLAQVCLLWRPPQSGLCMHPLAEQRTLSGPSRYQAGKHPPVVGAKHCTKEDHCPNSRKPIPSATTTMLAQHDEDKQGRRWQRKQGENRAAECTLAHKIAQEGCCSRTLTQPEHNVFITKKRQACRCSVHS